MKLDNSQNIPKFSAINYKTANLRGNLMFSKFKIYAILLIWCFTLSASLANEDHKTYIQLNGGVAFAQPFSEGRELCGPFGCESFSYQEKTDTGFASSIALGYHLTEQFRLEGEAVYQTNDLNKFTFSTSSFVSKNLFSAALQGERERTAFLLNAYYDFKNTSAFTPYFTAGIGGYHLRIKSSRFNPRPSRENDLDFAWQVGAGLNYRLNDTISFDLKYRYFSGSDAEVTFPISSGISGQPASEITELHEVGDHQVLAGIRIGF